jgi:hypothetical protein
MQYFLYKKILSAKININTIPINFRIQMRLVNSDNINRFDILFEEFLKYFSPINLIINFLIIKLSIKIANRAI